MEVKGKLIKFLDLETGTSKSGKEWQKQSIVIDTGGEFNNIISVSAFGDKVKNMNQLKEGMTVAILCNVCSSLPSDGINNKSFSFASTSF